MSTRETLMAAREAEQKARETFGRDSDEVEQAERATYDAFEAHYATLVAGVRVEVRAPPKAAGSRVEGLRGVVLGLASYNRTRFEVQFEGYPVMTFEAPWLAIVD
jgi:hypothetical protein